MKDILEIKKRKIEAEKTKKGKYRMAGDIFQILAKSENKEVIRNAFEGLGEMFNEGGIILYDMIK